MLPKQSRSQSGARPKVSNDEPAAAEEALTLEPLAPEPQTQAEAKKSSVAPESLRKPYASLAPQQKNKSDQPPHQASGAAASTWNDTTEARRWNDTTEARRRLGTCKKHKIALSPTHECLLCKREAAAEKKSSLTKIAIALIGLTVLALIVVLL